MDPAAPAPPLAPRLAVLLAVLALLAGACASADGVVAWRGLELTLPAGWVELNRSDTLLFLGDGIPPTEPGQRGELDLAMQVTFEPGASADDWRRFVADEDAELEQDEATSIGGVPARVLQFSFVTNGVPTRERIVVIPSRQLVILQQPVPLQSDRDGPERFLAHQAEFDALLDSIEFGAPEDYLDQ